MEDQQLIVRCSKYSELNAIKSLQDKLRVAKSKESTPCFFFGNFAELNALSLLLNKKALKKGLSNVNRFRNVLLKRISDPSEELRYELACNKRLSAKTLFAICCSLNVPIVVAYTTYYMQSPDSKPKVIFVLEQGGCTAIIKPSTRQVEMAKKSRLGI